MRKGFSETLILVLLTSMMAFSFRVQPAHAETITVPDDYLTIQEAINNANEGDTIFVRNGTYCECIVVNKTVELVGECSETTFLNSTPIGETTVNVTADNAIVTGFTIATQDLFGYEVPWNIAVEIRGSHNKLVGNTVHDSCCAVQIFGSYHVVANNTLWGMRGLSLRAANSTISRNDIAGNYALFNNGENLSTTIYGNTITGSVAVWLSGNAGLTVANNTIVDSDCGMRLSHVQAVIVCHNNFINNSSPVEMDDYYGYSSVTWDDGYPSGGNYWGSSYGSNDWCNGPSQNLVGSDGIGDTPLTLDWNNADHYPLMKPFPWAEHDIGVTYIGGRFWFSQPIIMPMKTVIGLGYGTSFLVFVMNYGSSSESFNLTVYANDMVIGTKTEVYVAAGSSVICKFSWATAGYAYGSYAVRAVADPVAGEADMSDNEFTIGPAYVSVPGDVDGNGLVSMIDLYLMALHYGGGVGYPLYARDYDIEDDGIISMIDMYAAAIHYGQHV